MIDSTHQYSVYSKLKLTLVVAMGRENRSIGLKGDLPWRLRGELAHFKAITMGKLLLMGRVTYESLPMPLTGREIIVLSKQEMQDSGVRKADEVFWCQTLEDAFELSLKLNQEELMVVGGATLYEKTLALADCLYVTLVDYQGDYDRTFPPFEISNYDRESLKKRERDEVNLHAWAAEKWTIRA